MKRLAALAVIFGVFAAVAHADDTTDYNDTQSMMIDTLHSGIRSAPFSNRLSEGGGCSVKRKAIHIGGKHCDLNCNYEESATPWSLDPKRLPSITGKRVAMSSSTLTVKYISGNTSCNCKDPSLKTCASRYGLVETSMVKYAMTCPRGSKYENRDGLGSGTTSACQKIINDCEERAKDKYMNQCNADYAEAMASRDSTDDPLLPCMRPTTMPCEESAALQSYESCIDSLVKGKSDCFCVNKGDPTSGGGDTFKFDTHTADWKCVSCPEGTKSDPYTGVGCVSVCSDTTQAWNPKTRKCEDCDGDVFQGECLPKCDTEMRRNLDTGKCERFCPPSMFTKLIGKNPDGSNQYECTCEGGKFSPSAPRSPVRLTSIPGFGTQGWAFNPDKISGDVSGAGCACSDFTDSPHVSIYDVSGVIDQPDGGRYPYGRVAVPQAASSLFVCACPNFNERFQLDSVTGKYRCVSALSGSDENALVLREIPESKPLANYGVDPAKSEAADQRMAYLRTSGMEGIEASVPYHRKVWRCASGYVAGADGKCKKIEGAAWDSQKCADGDTQVTASSQLNSSVVTMLKGEDFSKVVNKLLACCLSDRVDPKSGEKFHCAQTQMKGNFDSYYDQAGSPDFGVSDPYPTRLFLVNTNRRPVVGFYRENGSRCGFMSGETHARQLQLLSDGIHAKSVKNLTGKVTPQDVTQCRFAVRAALEVTCPPATYVEGEGYQALEMPSGVIRCPRAEEVKIHYEIVDFGPSADAKVKRFAFSPISTEQDGETVGIDVAKLIGQVKVKP